MTSGVRWRIISALTLIRVLTTCRSPERYESLWALARTVDDAQTGSEKFWFADESRIDPYQPRSIWDENWQRPRMVGCIICWNKREPLSIELLKVCRHACDLVKVGLMCTILANGCTKIQARGTNSPSDGRI